VAAVAAGTSRSGGAGGGGGGWALALRRAQQGAQEMGRTCREWQGPAAAWAVQPQWCSRATGGCGMCAVVMLVMGGGGLLPGSSTGLSHASCCSMLLLPLWVGVMTAAGASTSIADGRPAA
jgi:hypothetical protein